MNNKVKIIAGALGVIGITVLAVRYASFNEKVSRSKKLILKWNKGEKVSMDEQANTGGKIIYNETGDPNKIPPIVSITVTKFPFSKTITA